MTFLTTKLHFYVFFHRIIFSRERNKMFRRCAVTWCQPGFLNMATGKSITPKVAKRLVPVVAITIPVSGSKTAWLNEGQTSAQKQNVEGNIPLASPSLWRQNDLSRVQIQCALHGKKRTLLNLTETTPGRWECRKETPCLLRLKEVVCSLHGKKRMSLKMAETSPGRWECRKESPCLPTEVVCSFHGKKRISRPGARSVSPLNEEEEW